MTSPNPPTPGFYIITDIHGDPQTVMSPNSSTNHIFDLVGSMNRGYPDDSPHSVWQWNPGNGTFTHVSEKIHKDI